MAHFLRTQPDAIWKIGYKLTGADLIDLDEKTKKAVNGDGGGTWLPSTPIVIGGAGFGAGGPWNLSGSGAKVTGQIEFDEGSADDYFRFDAGHPETSLAVYQQLCEVYSEFPDAARGDVPSPAVTGTPNPRSGIISRVVGARFCFPLRCRNGGRITRVVFASAVGSVHSGIPAVTPSYAVFAIDAAGNRFPLRAQDLSTSADGFVQDNTAGILSVYNATGSLKTFNYDCNQNQVVDKSLYSYFAEVIDESGASSLAGNVYVSTTTQQDQITLLDGRG